MIHGEIQHSDKFVTDHQITNTYENQFHIGWNHIYLGRFDREWSSKTTSVHGKRQSLK